MEENHRKFLEHLRASDSTVDMIAGWLRRKGFETVRKPATEAPTRDQWESHADKGDLYVLKRIEVKRLSVDFTCLEDWPYGPKFIVCARHSFDLANPKPASYVIVNSHGTHAAVVDSRDSGNWYSEWRRDSRYKDVAQEFYLSPLKLVKFIKLEN